MLSRLFASALIGLSVLTLALVALALPAQAQVREFPFEKDARSGMEDVVLTARPEGMAPLLELQRVRLIDVPLPGDRLVDLELDRVPLAQFDFRVDGIKRPDLAAGLELSLWSGAVVGWPGSEVELALSPHGSRGFIDLGTERVHVLARSDERGAWRGDVSLQSETSLLRGGLRMDPLCAAKRLAETAGRGWPSPPSTRTGGTNGSGGGPCELFVCPIAIETDFQLYEHFNDLIAEAAYIATLYSFISARFEQQVKTVLVYPYVQLYSNANDPWVQADNGGSTLDILYEFQNAWMGSLPAGATLATFLSGADSGGGVAWLDVLCDASQTYTFSACGNVVRLHGQVNFPIIQRPYSWDFLVTAHELGHNFAAPHTHDYCPPIDECAPSGYFGACQTQQNCGNARRGTVMSYCHQCPGGTGNITTWFHPLNAELMLGAVRSCLAPYVGISPSSPSFTTPGVATRVEVCVTGTPSGPVRVHHRNGTPVFSTIEMTPMGGSAYEAWLPPASCGELPEYYFSYVDASVGSVVSPGDAPLGVYSLVVRHLVPLLEDHFETDQGWTAINLGATDGDWERGVPVDDPGWSFDPRDDFDGGGACYLTANRIGNTDVDQGAVQLVSPAFDLVTGTSPRISYAYYLNLSNEDGSDALEVEVSTRGLAGPWTEVARHATSGGLEWRTHTIFDGDLLGLGLVPSSNMHLRFTAIDADPQSVVEAGVDAFVVGFEDCVGMGSVYCTGNPNSTGMPGRIAANGSLSLLDNDVTLAASDLPLNAFGYFLVSDTPAFVPNPGGSQGALCLGGAIGRFVHQVMSSGMDGRIEATVDLTAIPQPTGAVAAVAGQTWNFQAWHRDANPSVTSNFSQAVAIVFE